AGCSARAGHQPNHARVSGDARAAAAGEVLAGARGGWSPGRLRPREIEAVSCGFTSRVDRHFAGSIHPASERALREHLIDCEACRGRYERRLMLERLDPHPRGAQDRLGQALGLHSPDTRWLGFTAAFAAAAAALILLVPRAPHPEFMARGKKLLPQVSIFKLRPGEPSRPAGEAIAAKDELAFAYLNPSDAKYLLVFGVDEHKHVYWYHPAWTDPNKKPVAVKITSEDEKVHELPAAIAHPLDGRTLDVVAVFASRPVSVTEIEDRVAQRGADRTLEIAGAVEAHTRLRVEK